MMTRTDFEKFATAIKDQVGETDRKQLESWEKEHVISALRDLAGDIADICESSNDLFDRDRFLKACSL